jgi:Cof subfamily protein (haloacid dehalogenase superfamily)
MLFLDLDGTLIGPEKGVRSSMMQALNHARDSGLNMAVCTGRSSRGLAGRIGRELAPDGPHIYESGAAIVNGQGEQIEAHALRIADALALAEHARSTEAVLEFYTASGVFVSTANNDCLEHADALDIDVAETNLVQVARDIPVLRAHWIARPHSIDAALAPDLPGVHVALASSPVLPRNVFASITRDDVDKGTAARRVAAIWGTPLGDCFAVGDSVGDLPILEVVGHGYVMENAPAELHARFPVLPSVHDDGVRQLLAQLLGEQPG